MERREASLFNRFSGWENHIAIPKHLGTIVPKAESSPNTKREKLDTPGKLTLRIFGCQKKRSENFSCQWPFYSFQSRIPSPKERAQSRIAGTNDYET